MRARILSQDEWRRLDGTDISALLPFVIPSDTAIVVVEDGERIVARWCVMQVTHFEGLWIDPEYRGNAGVVRPLLRQAYEIPRMRGERWAFSGAEDNAEHGLDRRVDKLLRKLGGQYVPIRLYAVPISGTNGKTEEACRQ